MFTGFEIQLAGPICGCSEENLSWRIRKDKYPCFMSILSIKCETCLTVMEVPSSEFLAHFYLEKPYPGDDSESVCRKSTFKVLNGGKVLDFDGNKK